jgi:hypothetical protein
VSPQWRPPTARLEFQIASNRFRAFAAGLSEFAAPQRGWRDFRIAQSGFERADPRCQKIGRRRLSRSRERTVEASDESARGRQQIFPRQT